MTMTAEVIKPPRTAKEKLIVRLNELRVQNNMPTYDPDKVKMSVDDIEKLIYDLETPSIDNRTPVAKITTAALLARLNVVRVKQGKKPLVKWKESRTNLERVINAHEQDKTHVTVQKGETRIAKGANTSRHNTALHKNKVVESVRKMDKREAKALLNEQKEIAAKVALSHGFHTETVLDYLIAKGLRRAELTGDALAEDIRQFVKTRESIGMKPKAQRVKAAPAAGKRKSSGSVTPSDIAAALSRAPRAVRITLRSREKDIPKLWRVEGERWGFKQEHKDDIIKFIKGDKT